MKKMLEEAYKSELKLDQKSVYGLCNSLNACSGPVRLAGLELAAFYMLRAEGTIFRLFDENQKLKQALKEKSKSSNPYYVKLEDGEVKNNDS